MYSMELVGYIAGQCGVSSLRVSSYILPTSDILVTNVFWVHSPILLPIHFVCTGTYYWLVYFHQLLVLLKVTS
jgi:hypothetical protein